MTYAWSFTAPFQSVVVSSSAHSCSESFVSQISWVSLNPYYMLLMIRGQARPFCFSEGNSTFSNPDSVLRELESSLNWGTSVCHENLPLFFFSFLMPFRALTCRWSVTKGPATEFLHRKYPALTRQGPGRKQFKEFLHDCENSPYCSEELALAPLQSSWQCKL